MGLLGSAGNCDDGGTKLRCELFCRGRTEGDGGSATGKDDFDVGEADEGEDALEVTVIGDAAHLMSPFAGEGANLAMYDGAELGEAIAANPGDIEAALLAYEKDLFPRSASAASEADRNLKLCFDDNAPQSLLDLFTSYRSVK